MGKEIKSYRDLEVWQRGMDLAEACYGLSDRFPKDERFALTSQLRRAVVSIPSSIAEGHNRRSRKAYAYHLDIALGSQAEVETCVELATRLSFIRDRDAAPVLAVAEEVGRRLHALVRAVADRSATAPRRRATFHRIG